jgi:hypothetical protein
MVIVKATPESEAGVLPDAQLMLDWGVYNEELGKAGILLAAEGLHPTSKGAVRISMNGTSRTAVDGPFAETKELIAGFSIIEVKSLDEAIAWVKRAPNCSPDGTTGEVEIRQIFEMTDFAPVLTDDQITHKIEKRSNLLAQPKPAK